MRQTASGAWGARSPQISASGASARLPAESKSPRHCSKRRRRRRRLRRDLTRNGSAKTTRDQPPRERGRTVAGTGHLLVVSEPALPAPGSQRPSHTRRAHSCHAAQTRAPAAALREWARLSCLSPPSGGEWGGQLARSTGGQSRHTRVLRDHPPGHTPGPRLRVLDAQCPSSLPEAGVASLPTGWRPPWTGHQAMGGGALGVRPRQRRGVLTCWRASGRPLTTGSGCRPRPWLSSFEERARPRPGWLGLAAAERSDASAARCRGCLPSPRRARSHRAGSHHALQDSRGSQRCYAPHRCPPRAAAGPSPRETGTWQR